MTRTRLALVLAGGGLAGIGWETGFLLGVQDEAPSAAKRLLEADVVLGTSAGSTVAAQITGGITLTEAYERQLSPPTTEITPSTDIDGLMELFERAAGDTTRSVTESLREIGAQAMAASTVGEEVRRSVIAARLPSRLAGSAA